LSEKTSTYNKMILSNQSFDDIVNNIQIDMSK
jgi:hypothetical protein